VSTVIAAVVADAFAEPALAAALTLADLLDAGVEVLTVREGPLPTAPQGFATRRADGDPVGVLVEAAAAPGVDALVLGRGVGAASRPAGSTALAVLAQATTPVLVVPPGAPPARIRRVLVPLEGTELSSRPVTALLERIVARGVEVIVLHVHRPATVPAFADHQVHAQRSWEREFLARFATAARRRARVVRRVGDPAASVVTVAAQEAVDLVVLSWNRQMTPRHALVVREALARVQVPVLLIAPAEDPVANAENP
jgi:nucleotide-binding universal stress UspA family protein